MFKRIINITSTTLCLIYGLSSSSLSYSSTIRLQVYEEGESGIVQVKKVTFYKKELKGIDRECYEEDKEEAQTRSLISGVDINELHSNPKKAALTLGFKPKSKHAYLVFELPIIREEDGQRLIKVQGFHFGPKNGYYTGHIIVGGDPKFYDESDANVLAKFFRAKKNVKYEELDADGKTKLKTGYIPYSASYQKEYTFIVNEKEADNAWKSIERDRDSGKVEFSIKGYAFVFNKKHTYNCTSYVAEILERAGINLNRKKDSSIVEDKDYLTNLIENFRLRQENGEEGDITLRIPPTAEQIHENNI